jgi:hypothetical protein
MHVSLLAITEDKGLRENVEMIYYITWQFFNIKEKQQRCGCGMLVG